MWRCAHPRRVQRLHEFPTAHRLRAQVDGLGAQLFGDVVVIALEAALGDTEQSSEVMELLQGRVADEVAPPPAAPGPVGVVDEQGHDYAVNTVESRFRASVNTSGFLQNAQRT